VLALILIGLAWQEPIDPIGGLLLIGVASLLTGAIIYVRKQTGRAAP
jgi:hypothetical protein